MQVDVAIVGAGIGGAVLGLALGQRGWRVALIERDPSPPRLARPEILWGVTPAALQKLGVGDRIRDEASVELEGIDVGRIAGPLLSISRDDLAAAGVRAFSTNPSLSRSMLVDAAVETGRVEVHHGVEVDEILRDGSRVVGVSGKNKHQQFAMEARLTIGDDGASSVVRTGLGIPISLSMFPIDFITATISWPDQLPPAKVHIRLNPAAFREGMPGVGLFPWPGRDGVMMIPLKHARAEKLYAASEDSFWKSVQQLTPLAPILREQLQFPRDFKRVRRPFGHAAHYVGDGAAILGDAAHPMSPAGGQGANAAVWDALALAEVADAALRAGNVSLEKLFEYERIRHPSNERSVAISMNAAAVVRVSRYLPVSMLVTPLAGLANRFAWPRRAFLQSFATTFVSRFQTPET